MIIGAGLFIIGLSFLLKNLGVLNEVTWSFIWPILLMIVGLSMVFNRRKQW